MSRSDSKAVRFLNDECLELATLAVTRQRLEVCSRPGELMDLARGTLGELIGEATVAREGVLTEGADPFTDELTYRAEAYVLSPADMRKLWDLIRAEVRQDLENENDLS